MRRNLGADFMLYRYLELEPDARSLRDDPRYESWFPVSSLM